MEANLNAQRGHSIFFRTSFPRSLVPSSSPRSPRADLARPCSSFDPSAEEPRLRPAAIASLLSVSESTSPSSVAAPTPAANRVMFRPRLGGLCAAPLSSSSSEVSISVASLSVRRLLAPGPERTTTRKSSSSSSSSTSSQSSFSNFWNAPKASPFAAEPAPAGGTAPSSTYSISTALPCAWVTCFLSPFSDAKGSLLSRVHPYPHMNPPSFSRM